MLSILQDILCAIEGLAVGIVNVLIYSINGLILLIGTTIALVLEELPAMPAPVAAPNNDVLELVNWLIPVAPLLGFCSVALSLWLAVMAVRILLNWLKAL